MSSTTVDSKRVTRTSVAFALALVGTMSASFASAHGSRLQPKEDQPIPPGTPSPSEEGEVRERASHEWSGLHVGGHVGYGFGTARGSVAGSPESRASFGSLEGGVRLGYDHTLGSRVLVGLEGDIAFPYFVDDGIVATRQGPRGAVTEKTDFVSTLRGRVGWLFHPWLVYASGGLAWSQARLHEDTPASDGDVLRLRAGWSVATGAEIALGPGWALRLQYSFAHLGSLAGTFASGTQYRATSTEVHEIGLGLSYRFGGATEAKGPRDAYLRFPFDDGDWNVHGQFTFIEQGYLHFHSPYEGTNSLTGASQAKNTASLTAFVGARLWHGAELYFNPEIDQGFGLSQTLGIAGFPNGEAQKAAYPVPRFNVDRVFVRQTIGLGGEQTLVEDGPNQIAGKRDVSRVTITVGRLSVGDSFLLNTYAADPRTQFLNWNVYGGGSYDWTMDRPGWTWGAVVDLNQKDWALRAGYFLENTESNGNAFDLHIPSRGQWTAEPEVRYSLLGQPGKLRLFGWFARANMGSYADAVANMASAADPPDLTPTRRVRTTWGFVANVEQALSDQLGLFSRLSWTPGHTEVMGWTDCDESLSLGAALHGAAWKRPNDTLGLGGVVEGLSGDARAFFSAGGMGIVIGDGRMQYATEQVVEAYYSLAVARRASLTLDYQFVRNPAYNADRGPVSIWGARLHAEM
jgi:high affinity Mn2+ porin